MESLLIRKKETQGGGISVVLYGLSLSVMIEKSRVLHPHFLYNY